MRGTTPSATLGFCLALVSAVALVLSPIGYRLNWWDVRTALLYLVAGGIVLSITALVISLFAVFRTRPSTGKQGFALALAGIAISLVFAGFPAAQIIKSRNVPRIHDITTDTEIPPRFVALAAIRQASPNGIEYAGGDVAMEQKQAYPEITPYRSTLPADQMFNRAEAIVHEAGWNVAAAVLAEGRIEATDTTLLYGFKDDVVIRITPTANGSQVDMRSTSRVGGGDMGVNAARIRKFLIRLKETGA